MLDRRSRRHDLGDKPWQGEKACTEELPDSTPSHSCSNGTECGSGERPGRGQGLQKVRVAGLDSEENGKKQAKGS